MVRPLARHLIVLAHEVLGVRSLWMMQLWKRCSSRQSVLHLYVDHPKSWIRRLRGFFFNKAWLLLKTGDQVNRIWLRWKTGPQLWVFEYRTESTVRKWSRNTMSVRLSQNTSTTNLAYISWLLTTRHAMKRFQCLESMVAKQLMKYFKIRKNSFKTAKTVLWGLNL